MLCPFHAQELTPAADRKTAQCKHCGLTWKQTRKGLQRIETPADAAAKQNAVNELKRRGLLQ